jgi:hypothetical protein
MSDAYGYPALIGRGGECIEFGSDRFPDWLAVVEYLRETLPHRPVL